MSLVIVAVAAASIMVVMVLPAAVALVAPACAGMLSLRIIVCIFYLRGEHIRLRQCEQRCDSRCGCQFYGKLTFRVVQVTLGPGREQLVYDALIAIPGGQMQRRLSIGIACIDICPHCQQ